jgi:hypothetical protein
VEQWLTGDPGRRITRFEGELIRDFHWFHPGKQLVVARGHLNGSVELIAILRSRLVNRLIDTASESRGRIPLFTIWKLFPAARCRSLAGLLLPLLLPHPAT